jgi:hypothetical protein
MERGELLNKVLSPPFGTRLMNRILPRTPVPGYRPNLRWASISEKGRSGRDFNFFGSSSLRKTPMNCLTSISFGMCCGRG